MTTPHRHREPWSAAEIHALRRLAPHGMSAIVAELERSAPAIKSRAREIAVSIAREKPRRRGRTKGFKPRTAAPDLHPAVRALILEANRRRMPLAEIARAAGLPEHVMRHWRRAGHPIQPKLGELAAALAVVGLEMAIVPSNNGSP